MKASLPDDSGFLHARRIEHICDRFEQDCRAGSPRPEDYLDGVPASEQAGLLEELRLLADYHAQKREQSPSTAVPDDPDLIETSIEKRILKKVNIVKQLPIVAGYELLEELGRGGMGVVYKARQVALNRVVALKMILTGEHVGAETLIRFKAEAEAIAQLQHPHIVQIHEVSTANGVPYLVLEFIEGGTLGDHLAGTPVPAHDAARLIEILARAVQHAHERGIIHRDLKPGNVLLQCSLVSPRSGDAERVLERRDYIPKVTDFGLAKRLSESVGEDQWATQTGAILGTPSYMAPEQASGRTKEVGPVADIYALGAMLYETLTGRPPFKAESALETLLQVQTAEPVSPRRLNVKVPIDLETICLTCLHKTPARRYSSAAALADDLRRFQNGEAIHARQTRSIERAWLWCRRNPWVASLSAAVALLLATVAVVALMAYVETSHALGVADQERTTANEERKAAQEAEALAIKEAAWSRRLLYDADMQLASQFWVGNDGTATAITALLDAHIPRQGEEDLRDFTWHLQRKLLRRNIVMTDKDRSFVLVAIKSNGQMVTLDTAPSIRHWDATTRRLLRRIDFKHIANFSIIGLTMDGRTAVLGTRDSKVHVYDAEAGYLRQVLNIGARVYDVKFSQNGRLMGVTSWDKVTRVFDVATLKELHRIPMNSVKHAQMALSQDGETIILADHPARHFSSYNRHKGFAKYPQDMGTKVQAIACSPDGRLHACGDIFGKITVRDARTRQHVVLLGGHVGPIRRLAFSHNSIMLAAGMENGQVVVWNMEKRQTLWKFKGHLGMILSLAFSADDKWLATGSVGAEARLWDLSRSTESKELRPAGHVLAYSGDGTYLVTVGQRTPTRLWDARTLKRIGTFGQLMTCATISPDGKLVATGRDDGQVILWDRVTRKELLVLGVTSTDLSGSERAVNSLAFSADGRYLAVGSGYPLFGSSGGVVKVWEVATSKVVAFFKGFKNSVSMVTFSARAGLLAAACADGQARLWEVRSWREVRTLKHEGCYSLAFSPDGKTLVTGGYDHQVRVWDVESANQCLALHGHSDVIWAIAYSPDGKTIASGGRDKTVKLWDPVSGRELRTLRNLDHWVSFLAFSPDNRTLATGMGSMSVRLWQADGP
jgi:WD40 repeat protein/serine/threonine protein kinase